MEDQSYKLILEGRLRDGLERPRAIKKLSVLLKRDLEEVASLLSGEPSVIAEGLDYRAALRYQSLLGSAGALSRIESEDRGPRELTPAPAVERTLAEQPDPLSVEQPAPLPAKQPAPLSAKQLEPPPVEQSEPLSKDLNACPKCGYQPTREDDVLLIRGDCPRCGLKVANNLLEEPEQVVPRLSEDRLSQLSPTPIIYGNRIPASWKRRVLASVHTFLLFLAVYCCLAMLFIFSLVPLESVSGYAGKGFLHAAFISFPILLPLLSIILISFVLPIFNQGLTWGQKMAAIVVLYTQEAQLSGLYLSLAFRVVSMGLVSFAPGLIILWLGAKLGWVPNEITANAVVILMAILGWLGSWVYLLRDPDKRGILDRAGGTIQTEEEPLPENAMKKALMPIGIVVGLSMLLGIIIPLSLRALK